MTNNPNSSGIDAVKCNKRIQRARKSPGPRCNRSPRVRFANWRRRLFEHRRTQGAKVDAICRPADAAADIVALIAAVERSVTSTKYVLNARIKREALIRTYLERDLPQLGIQLAASTLERFWTMLAHYHAQTWNSSELARSFGVSDKTVRHWLDLLSDTYMVQLLRPWSANVGKRVVKAPKVYLRDTGLLHTLLRLRTAADLNNHPKLGASFEGFALSSVIRRLAVSERDCYFWSTYQEAELDLLVARGSRRLGFKFNHTAVPEVTKSMRIALSDLELERLDVIHVGKETYPLSKQIRAVAFGRMQQDIEQLP